MAPLFLDRFRDNVKIGTIIPWSNRTTTPPIGWLKCDGSQYPGPTVSELYWQLYQEIGTKYNTGGETSGYFRVPNLQDKLLGRASGTTVVGQEYGSLNSASNFSNYTTLTNDHMPQHNHVINFNGNSTGSANANRANNQILYPGGGAVGYQFQNTNTVTVFTSNVTGNALGGGTAQHRHALGSGSNKQTDLSVLYLIKYKYSSKDDFGW